MIVVILDQPDPATDSAGWARLAERYAVRRWPSSSLFELLDRGREADVLVTFGTPLRREVLDYVTRPRLIVTAPEADRLVEMEIAAQLGLPVRELAGTADWPAELADVLEAWERNDAASAR